MKSMPLLWLMPLVAFAGEKTVKPEQVPAAVVKAATERYPKGKITKYIEEIEGGKKSYEVVFELDGQKVEVIIGADGKLLEEERVMTASDLPPEVTKAIADSKHAKAKIARVERVEDLSTRASPVWEVVVEEGGKRRELVFKNGAIAKDKEAGHED